MMNGTHAILDTMPDLDPEQMVREAQIRREAANASQAQNKRRDELIARLQVKMLACLDVLDVDSPRYHADGSYNTAPIDAINMLETCSRALSAVQRTF